MVVPLDTVTATGQVASSRLSQSLRWDSPNVCLPGLQQHEQDRDQRRTDEQTQEAEGEKAAEDAKNGQRQRHLKTEAEQPRFEEIVDRADERAPNDHENAPGGVIEPE